ncbi:MAG: hypothetical protein NTY88_10285 [Bacteroidetes bacterium]|nr:hypothetical protein [Bacteroidota bacterium]
MKRNLLLIFFLVFILSSCRTPCDNGYEGKRCDVPVRDKFMGIWNANDSDGSATFIYTDTITSGTSEITDVLISKNFSGNRYFKTVKGTATANSISIFPTDQKIDTGKIYAVGTGTISSDSKTINWNYTLTNKTDSPEVIINYTGVWTKQ